MKKPTLIFLLLCFGCNHPPKTPIISVSFTNNRQSIKFTGLDKAILNDILRDSIPNIWQNLMPVYKMPADTDLKDLQPFQPGSYRVADSVLIFTPDTAFNKNSTYFLRFYKFAEGTSLTEYVTGKGKLRSNNYIDLIFK